MRLLNKAVSACFMTCSVTAMLWCVTPAWAADGNLPVEPKQSLKEMPVLTGVEWQSLQPETKMAFILGIGHVVTIEENVIGRHPELKRKGFVAKLAEGLEGVPMDGIIQSVDTFYAKNPDDLGLPVMGVIWQQIVKPKLKAGIADRPFASEYGQ